MVHEAVLRGGDQSDSQLHETKYTRHRHFWEPDCDTPVATSESHVTIANGLGGASFHRRKLRVGGFQNTYETHHLRRSRLK